MSQERMRQSVEQGMSKYSKNADREIFPVIVSAGDMRERAQLVEDYTNRPTDPSVEYDVVVANSVEFGEICFPKILRDWWPGYEPWATLIPERENRRYIDPPPPSEAGRASIVKYGLPNQDSGLRSVLLEMDPPLEGSRFALAVFDFTDSYGESTDERDPILYLRTVTYDQAEQTLTPSQFAVSGTLVGLHSLEFALRFAGEKGYFLVHPQAEGIAEIEAMTEKNLRNKLTDQSD